MAFTEGFWTSGLLGTVARMNACLLGWGLKSEFPAASAANKGRMAWATDEAALYYSDGTAWVVMVASASSSSGNYTGDATANRAIAHGLGVAPRLVFIVNLTTVGTWFRIITGLARITGADGSTANATGPIYAVTAMDATNFYVGDGVNHQWTANFVAYSYYWVAIK